MATGPGALTQVWAVVRTVTSEVCGVRLPLELVEGGGQSGDSWDCLLIGVTPAMWSPGRDLAVDRHGRERNRGPCSDLLRAGCGRLGDVRSRSSSALNLKDAGSMLPRFLAQTWPGRDRVRRLSPDPVSYTHLTLPTNREV